MKENVLPLRFAILKLLGSRPEGMNCQEIYDQLKRIYQNERQCMPDTIDGHLMSMKGVGLVDVKDAVLAQGKLDSTYVLTEYGISRISSYI